MEEHKYVSKQPLVSVIMPAFNSEKSISGSILSVINQTIDNWELIVVDDASKDNTLAIVQNLLKSDDRIRVLSLAKNSGVSNARNLGIKQTTGEYVAFLDSDDLWHKDKLKKQTDFHTTNSSIKISHTDFHFFNELGIQKRNLKYLIDFRSDKEGLLYPKLCYKNTVGILTVLIRRDLLQRAGEFDTSLQGTEDHDLLIRIAKEMEAFGYLPEILAYYKVGNSGLSGSHLGRYKTANKKLIRKLLINDRLESKLLWRAYYRYFGILYLKRNSFKISFHYFIKSVWLIPFDYISTTTYMYMIYAYLKKIIYFVSAQR